MRAECGAESEQLFAFCYRGRRQGEVLSKKFICLAGVSLFIVLTVDKGEKCLKG